MSKEKFLVCHNRDRDDYQVALALQEIDALQGLVTDHYVGAQTLPFAAILDRVLNHRQIDGLPSSAIIPSLKSVFLQASLRLPVPKPDLMYWSDVTLGNKVLNAAKKYSDASLLLYSTNAYEAFTEKALADRRKVLFLYHPLPKFIENEMRQDVLWPDKLAPSSMLESKKPYMASRLDAEIAHADEVICASSTTRRSIEFSGYFEKPTTVVPYGMNPVVRNRATITKSNSGKIRFLFVGQAIQRKGLHHLLEAWRRAKLPHAELRVVFSSNPDGIMDTVPEGVVPLGRLSRDELVQEFSQAHCFVLPALLEGFGLVLLEAASAGCYTIFSDATGFADLDIPSSVGMRVKRNDIESLKLALESYCEMHLEGRVDPDAIVNLAKSFSTSAFREKLRRAILG